MSKILNQEIEVILDDDNGPNPTAFIWRGATLTVVSICESWRDTGQWWSGESEKAFYRVEVEGQGLYEIYLSLKSGRWYLYKIYD